MTVHHVSLADCLEGASPPEKTLTIGVVDDTAFVYINAVQSGAKSETQVVTAEIAVSLPSLLEALVLLGNDRSREGLRGKAESGGREAWISGTRLTVAPL